MIQFLWIPIFHTYSVGEVDRIPYSAIDYSGSMGIRISVFNMNSIQTTRVTEPVLMTTNRRNYRERWPPLA